MNAPLLRLSGQIKSMHRLHEKFTGTINVRYEFKDGMIVQVKRISSEEVINLKSMSSQEERSYTAILK